MKKDFTGIVKCMRDETGYAFCTYIDAPHEEVPRKRAVGLKIENFGDWLSEHFLHSENENKHIKITVEVTTTHKT